MEQETISFEVGFINHKPIFHLRMATVQEESEFLQRFNDASDSDNEEKNYRVLVDIIKKFSISVPEIEKDGKRNPLVEDESDPANAVERYFSHRTTAKERIANSAVIAYRSSMLPDVNFF